MEDQPLGRIAYLVPEFAVKDVPLGRILMMMRVAFVPLPPWYSPTQPPASQLTLNVTKPRPFTQLAAKLFATYSTVI